MLLKINSDFRFPLLSGIRKKANEKGWASFDFDKDARGFYITAVELNSREATIIKKMSRSAGTTPAVAIKRAPRIVRPINTDGPVYRVREWARANCEATKEQAVAAFPELNAATVKIQLRKVRKGEV